MTYFPDVNVWIAMSLPGPIHYPAAVDRFNRTNENQIAFCRVTQMGFLRLLTNRHVMGANVLTPARAWQAFDDLLRNAKIFFAEEPADLREWRTIMHRPGAGSNAWTDAYLAAFAIASRFTVVSFDAGFPRHRRLPIHLLRQ
jgi:toxin-antitoxin system PIN domain toxin